MRKNCGMMPNTLVFSASQIPNLKANTDLKDRLKYTTVVTSEAIIGMLSALLGIPNIVIANANTVAQ